MDITGVPRFLRDHFWGRSPRQTYWTIRSFVVQGRRLFSAENAVFRAQVRGDLSRYLLHRVKPVEGESAEHMHAAVQWLLRAQATTGNGGVSHGYFPCDRNRRWRAAYPETTGYIITSLLAYADRYNHATARAAALEMARWEVSIQMPCGAVQGGQLCPPEEQSPCAFNTGMVLDGWCSAFAASHGPAFLEAGRRAADFLVGDLTPDYYFRTNGKFVAPATIKTYNALNAWALYRFSLLSGEATYADAALRIIEAALRKQNAAGWFADNCLDRPEAPLSHTIGYTLQAVLEVGILAGRTDFVESARRGLDAVLSRMSADGFLPGRFYCDWVPAVFSSCLTGSAQVAIVAYRASQHTGRESYRRAADKLVNYLKALQLMESEEAELNGALAGSFPIIGGYMTFGYPNWATKYFLDALMLQSELREANGSPSQVAEVLA